MTILNDDEITRLGNSGILFTEGFSAQNVKQACYELRASESYFEMLEGTAHLRQSTSYILKPHSYLVVATIERLKMPNDMIGRILSKGHLFSLGIIPVNTYADPGFEGQLGITLFNGSCNVIKIESGQTIAKIEFNRLSSPVSNPYHGQHGLSLNVWPVPNHLIVPRHELRRYGFRSSHDLNRVYYGDKVADIIADLDFYKRWVWIQVTVAVVGVAALMSLQGDVSLGAALGIGLGSNLLTSLLGTTARRLGLFKRI